LKNDSGNDVLKEELSLVQRCLSGDSRAQYEFVEKYKVLVFGVCLRMLGDRQEAEDASQDVFVRALRSLHRWDQDRPLRPWLLTITSNRCRTYLHQRRRRPAATEYVDEIVDPRGEQDDSRELWQEIRRALESMRPEYQTVFMLFHEQGLNYEEMSLILSKPVGTLKTWLHRARQEMLTILRRKGLAAEVSNETTDD
jgi:RNA polymerase sigma-70 factor (ECF subfamily)